MKTFKLDDVKNHIAKEMFGTTPAESKKSGVCIRCKKVPDFAGRGEADCAEFRISGFCPNCWDEIFAGEEE